MSGAQRSLTVNVDFETFLINIGRRFGFVEPRVYILTRPDFSWQKRIRLTADNFSQLQEETGIFATIYQLYASNGVDSPAQSPGHISEIPDKAGDYGSNRSGQSEFNAAIISRDEGNCVFCSSSDDLEAAHILPVESKSLLIDPANRTRYGIASINDSCNGIALCRGCHKCFDAKLICIDPVEHTLMIADALLANKSDKFRLLTGKKMRLHSPTPNRELLQFRVDAMEAATAARHA